MSRSVDQKQADTGRGSESVDARISREIAGIYTEYYGRVPTRAKTRLVDELVICLLDDVFGKAEKVLVEAGHFEQVRLNRAAIRTGIEPLMRAIVETSTGRTAEACMGQVADEGRACEIFILGEAPSPAAA